MTHWKRDLVPVELSLINLVVNELLNGHKLEVYQPEEMASWDPL